MENLILDYSSNFSEYKKHEEARSIFKKSEYDWKKEKEDFDLTVNNPLYGNIWICPYCLKEMLQIHKSLKKWDDEEYSGNETFYMFYCVDCGYWSTDYEWNDTCHNGYGDSIKEIINHRAILRTFEIDSNLIPTETLTIEVTKRPELLYNISPRKLEDLMQQVFSSYYNCEVEHCGGSHDGGIDLFILVTDNPILVQVKRRMNPKAVEPVSLIRELLGAMFIKDSKKGIFVSTANKFSLASEKLVSELLAKNKLDYFELINFNRLNSILSLSKKHQKKPWINSFNQFYDESMEIIMHNEKYFTT